MHETDERREPREEPVEEPDPRWEPAERHLPEWLLYELMWMGSVSAAGRSVQQYKHDMTRRYLNLDLAGQAWDVSVAPGTGEVSAEQIDTAAAIAHLTGGGQ